MKCCSLLNKKCKHWQIVCSIKGTNDVKESSMNARNTRFCVKTLWMSPVHAINASCVKQFLALKTAAEN